MNKFKSLLSKYSKSKSGQIYYLEGLEDLVKAYPSYVGILAKVTLQIWADLLPGGAGGPGESLSLICG